MIQLYFKNKDHSKIFFDLFNQLLLDHYLPKDEINTVFRISIEVRNKSLHIVSDSATEIKILLPCRIVDVIGELEIISKKFYFKIVNIFYYPLKQQIKKQENSIQLNLIHNNILKQLVIKKTISKSEIYKIIWPNDKDYSVNKLDTHITNLKNLILKEFNLNINFESNKGILKITT